MRECVLGPLGHERELGEERILCDGVWLGDDEVVTVREQVKGVLEEVFRAAVEDGLHAEERDCEGVLG